MSYTCQGTKTEYAGTSAKNLYDNNDIQSRLTFRRITHLVQLIPILFLYGKQSNKTKNCNISNI